MLFQRLRTEITLAIRPKYLNDPSTSIFKQLQTYMLRYSSTISGFPLLFTVEGILPIGKILPDGCIRVVCLVGLCIFKVGIGDVLYSTDGMVCGAFNTLVDGNENYTGEISVKSIGNDVIQGNAVIEEEFSDL